MSAVVNMERHQPTPQGEPWLEVLGSPRFSPWLAEEKISLAFTTYQLGKLFLLGRKRDDRISVFERTFSRCMGLWAEGQTIWMSLSVPALAFGECARSGQCLPRP